VNAAGESGRDLLYELNNSTNWQTSNVFTGIVGGTYRIKVKYAAPYDGCTLFETVHAVRVPQVVSFTLVPTPVSCNNGTDGAIKVMASGGSGTYTYSISGTGVNITDQVSDTFTGLGAGTYTVSVKDNNDCPAPATQSITLANPAELVITDVKSTNITCPAGPEDGTITVIATGGTPTLMYSIDGGITSQPAGLFTGLAAGTGYVVRVTDHAGCYKETSAITIERPATISFTATADNTMLACDDATTFITVEITSPATGSFVYRLQGRNWQTYNNSGTNTIESVGKGNNVVEVSYADGQSCASFASQTVKVEPIRVEFTLTGTKNDCAGQTNGSITVVNPSLTAGVEYKLTGPENRPYQTGLTFANLPGGNYMVTARVIADGCTVDEGINISDPDAVSITDAVPANLTCSGSNDGEIHITATGGTSPLTYAITGTGGTQSNATGNFTGLPAGDYTITVTDAKNCASATRNITLTQPDEMKATIRSEDVACFGETTGSATVTVTGGTTPYKSYEWKDGANNIVSAGPDATGLAAGTYTVTVFDFSGLCSVTESVTIIQPATGLTLTLDEKKDITCADASDGYIRVGVSGGTSPYTYTINGLPNTPASSFEFSGLYTGTYDIVVTDASGCTANVDPTPIRISAPDPITGNFSVDQPVSCYGVADGSLTFHASGGGIKGTTPTYVYEWSTGATTATISGLIAGDYSVTAGIQSGSDVICKKTFYYTLTQPDGITVTSSHTDAVCNGEDNGTITLAIAGGTLPYQITWTGTDGYASTGAAITNLAPGTYNYSVIDANKCTSTTATGSVTVAEPAKIDNIQVRAGAIACADETTTLTITADGDQENLAYSINGSDWQQTNTFEVRTGTHTVYAGYWISATEARCVDFTSITVTARPVITISNVAVDKPVIPCNETTTKVTITANGEDGTNGLEYRIDPDAAWQTGNIFNAGAGTYTACVRYTTAPNCPVCDVSDIVITRDIDITIGDADVTGSPLNCADDQTASITITATGNGDPLQYGLKKGANTIWQDNGLFTGLGAGNYEVLARYPDNVTCFQSGGIYTITAPDAIVPSNPVIGKNTLDCAGDVTTVTVDIPGTGIEYSIDGGSYWYDAGATINNVPAGSYQVIARYKDKTPGADCRVTGRAFTITAPAVIQVTAKALKPTLDCFDETTEIQIEATGQDGYAFEYSIDGGSNWQPYSSFTNVEAGSYQVMVRYKAPAAPCEVPGPAVVVTAPAEIQITGFSSDVTTLPCNDPTAKATLTITVTGDPNMEYSIDGGRTWDSNGGIFTGMGVGTYTACVRYAGTTCQVCYDTPVTVSSAGDITGVTLTAAKTKLSCDETSTTLSVTVDPPTPATGSYEYEINSNGNWQDDPQFSDIPAGTFTVKVRNKDDQDCVQASNTVKIVKPNQITATVAIDEAACHDGQTNMQVNATGSLAMTCVLTPAAGMPLISSNGQFTDVPDGTYTLVVAYVDPYFNACSYTETGITVSKPAAIVITDVTADITELQCDDATTALTVTATGSTGKAMEFSIDGTNWYSNGSNSYVFTVGAGTYRAQARYVTMSPDRCTVVADPSMDVTVTAWAPIVMTVNPDKTLLECDETSVNVKVTATGEPDRTIELSANGSVWVSAVSGEYVFALPAGAYTISARYHDNINCVVNEALNIDRNINISIDRVIAGSLDCAGDVTNIEIQANGESGKTLEYTVDGSTWVPGGNSYTAMNVGAGSYTIGVRYAGETCTRWYTGNPVTITAPDRIKVDYVLIDGVKADHADLSCPGDRAVITVEANGSQALEYSIDGGATWQDSKTFPDMPGGNYSFKVRYKDGAKCEAFYDKQVTVFVPAVISITSVDVDKANLDCAGETTTITLNATGERKAGYDLQYSIDGGAHWQTSPVFPNAVPGAYQPRVRYANHTGCTPAQAPDITITAPAEILIESVEPVNSSLACDGATTPVTVNIASSEPGRDLEYSLDNTNWYTLAALPEVGPGAFTVYVRYVSPYAGCTVQASGLVSSSVDIVNAVASADKHNLTCDGFDVATITVTVDSWDNTKTLQYRMNGSIWQDDPEFTVSVGGSFIVEVSYKEDVPPCPQPSNMIVITKPQPISVTKVEADFGKTNLDCYGNRTNITVYVNAQAGQSLIYTLYKDNAVYGTPQTDNNVFTDIGAGKYEVEVSYADGTCGTRYNQAITITEPLAIEIDRVNAGAIQCEGDQATLTVLMKAYDTTRSLEFSADGVNWQTSDQLLVGAGTYDHIQVRYKQPAPACAVTYGTAITVAAPDVITIGSVITDKTSVDCATSETAIITVTASTGGSRSLEYSYDGGVTWEPQPVKTVTSGSYDIWVRFAGVPYCPKHAGEIIIQGNAEIEFTNVAVENPITCRSGAGSITVTVVSTASPQATDLQLSINGGAWEDVTPGTPYVFDELPAGTYIVRARSQAVPECIVVSTPPVQLTEPDPIVASVVSQTDASGCYTGSETPGSATIGVTGGTAPYKYQVDSETTWHNFTGNMLTITGLKSGDHTIRVSDANDCTEGVATVTISNSDVINIVASAVSIRCFGEANGQLTIHVTQGHAPFSVMVHAPASFDNRGNPISPAYNRTFTINNYSDALVINDLYANTYMITVTDANSCIGSEEIKITQPTDPLELTIDPINICPGDTKGGYVPHTDGGWPGYNYYWYYRNDPADDFAPMYLDESENPTNQSPARNDLDPGEYQVIAVDYATCRDTTVFEIVDLTSMRVDDIRLHGVVCKNPNSGSIKIVNPQGGANGYYVYRVRYQDGSAIVPGYGYREWPTDSIYGLAEGTYIVDMLDHKGMGCDPLTFENLVIGVETGISIDEIDLTNPNCFYSNDGRINGITVTGIAAAPLEYKLKYWNGVEAGWQATAVFDTISTGNYTLYVREKDGLGNGCEAEQDFVVDNPPQININITDRVNPNCENSPKGYIDFEVWGGTGNLTVTYNGAVESGDFNPATEHWEFHVEPNKGGWAIIEATDASGCVDTVMRKIPYATDLAFDKIRIIPNNCPDDITAQIKAIASDQKGSPHTGFTYRLYTGIATIPANLVNTIEITNLTDTASFENLANGTYVLSMQADGDGCFTNDSVVNILNTNNIELTNVSVVNDCPSRIIFTIDGDPSNTSYSYSINGSLPIPVTEPVINGVAENVVITGLVPGTYAVTIYYGECEYTETFTVQSKVEPTVTPHAVTGCYGDANGSIDITMPDNSGVPYKYWYSDLNPGDYKPFTTSLKTTVTNLKAGDYKVMIQQYGGCFSDTIRVTVDDASRMNIGFTETVPITCKGQYGEGDITVSGGVGTYTASVVPQSEGGYPPYADPPVLSGMHLSHVTGGQYRIAIVDNGTGCKDTLELDIHAPRVVEITAAQPAIICAASADQTSTITVQVTKPTAGTFEYSINGVTVETSSNPTYTYNVISGTWKIEVREQSSSCLADTVITVNIPQPMTLDVPVTLTDQGDCSYTGEMSINITGGAAPYIIKVNGATITGTTFTVVSGTYNIEVWDASNCYASKTENVTVPKGITVIPTIYDPLCNEGTKSRGNITLEPKFDYTYVWDDYGKGVQTGNNISDLEAGTYGVTITTLDGSCSVHQTYTVASAYVLDATVAFLNTSDREMQVCPDGGLIRVTGDITGKANPGSTLEVGTIGGVWHFYDNTVEMYDPNHKEYDLKPGSGEVMLTAEVQVKDATRTDVCRATSSVTVQLYDVPTVIMATDTVYIPKDEIYTLNTGITGDYQLGSVVWSANPSYGYHDYGQTVSPVEISAPEPNQAYTLKISVTNEIGCRVSDSIYVSRALDFFIPNAFTPNDDSNHDTWKFRNIEQYIDYYEIQVAVFNRGGFQVYSGKGYNNSSMVWDGRRSGNDLPIGTYYYVVKLVPKSATGTTHTFKGSVTIIR
jgi:gliding motility-associated-like protein